MLPDKIVMGKALLVWIKRNIALALCIIFGVLPEKDITFLVSESVSHQDRGISQA